mgnify:CR=1 FL=1
MSENPMIVFQREAPGVALAFNGLIDALVERAASTTRRSS